MTGYIDQDSEKVYNSKIPVETALFSWTPTVAPSGIDYFSAKSIPEWKNSLLVTTLKENDLRILKLDNAGSKIISEKIIFHKKYGRLRDVLVSPEGDIYVSTSNRDWNPSPGFPKKEDDRILVIRKIRTVRKRIIKKESTQVAGPAITTTGRQLYIQYCGSCHKEDGKGLPGTFPALAGSKMVNGNKVDLITLVLNGRTGAVKINGVNYDQPMPAFKFMSDKQLADVLSFVRLNFSNKAGSVAVAEIKAERNSK